jgi:signal transduction histidine kinase
MRGGEPKLETEPNDVSLGLTESPGNGLSLLSASREHLRDLAALLALPRMWQGREPEFIARSLLDVLVTLLRLDVACVRLSSDKSTTVVQDCRPANAGVLETLLGGEDAASSRPRSVTNLAGPGTVHLMYLTPQIEGERAFVAVGSQHASFPTELEGYLCRLAVEQALLAVHASRLVTSLKVANTAKATFLATMSHELRTPLNVIVGYAELLHGGISGALNTPQKHHIERIDAAARHLIGLIESILSFARIEAGKEEVHLSTVVVAELTEDVATLIEPLAEAKGLSLEVTVSDRALQATTDASKLRQVLLNLLSNAVKFTHDGYIVVDVRPDGGDVVWSVRDSGVGIADDDLPRVFEPFRQVGDVHTKRGAGTGLGLSVSRQLARLLGGDVSAESTLSKGSTFTLRLPRESPDVPGRAQ